MLLKKKKKKKEESGGDDGERFSDAAGMWEYAKNSSPIACLPFLVSIHKTAGVRWSGQRRVAVRLYAFRWCS